MFHLQVAKLRHLHPNLNFVNSGVDGEMSGVVRKRLPSVLAAMNNCDVVAATVMVRGTRYQ